MDTNKLERAKSLIEQIETLNTELSGLFRSSAPAPVHVPAHAGIPFSSPRAPKAKAKKVRNMTPEGRAAISAAAKKRWAAFKKAKKAQANA